MTLKGKTHDKVLDALLIATSKLDRAERNISTLREALTLIVDWVEEPNCPRTLEEDRVFLTNTACRIAKAAIQKAQAGN